MGPTTSTRQPVGGLSPRTFAGLIAAAAAGSTLAWYDLFLYGLAALLVLGKLFFPAGDGFLGQVLAVGTVAAGYLARPFGAALFGHLGDRIGRRATLIATLGLMGLATALTGLLPTYAQAGAVGGVLLVLLRVVQGLAAGGEWAGAVLLLVESGRRGHRGFLGSWAQLGQPAGLVLALGAVQLSALGLGADSYWGWRAPFLLSALLLLVGLYLRLGVPETPVFQRLLADGRIEEAPVAVVLARQWREVGLAALLRAAQQAPFFLFTVFFLGYATGNLGLDRSAAVAFLLAGAGLAALTMPLWGHLGDLVGRRRLYLAGAVALALVSYPCWALVETRVPLLVAAAIVIALCLNDALHAPQAALIAESITARLRYSGASLGYQIGSAAGDAAALAIGAALVQRFGGSLPVAGLTAACGLAGVAAALLLRDRSHQDLAGDYEPAPRPVRAAAPQT
jgi:MFS family permease